MAEVEMVTKKSNPRKTRRMLKTIALCLLEARGADIPVNYPRNSNEYSRRRTSGNDCFTRTYALRIIDAWEALGYIGTAIGVRNPESGDGWQSRMWGTPKLWATFEHYGLISTGLILNIKRPDEVLFLRERDDKETGKKGADIPFRQTPYTKQVIGDLERYNNFVEGFEVNVSLGGEVNVNADFLADYLFRNIQNGRITLTEVRYKGQSIIRRYNNIWAPHLLTTEIPPHLTQDIRENTITNTKMRKRMTGGGLRGFDQGADRFMNFLFDEATKYWKDKAYKQKQTVGAKEAE
jgi:hypothetical protein